MRYVGVRHIVIDGAPTPTPIWTPDQAFAGRTIFIIGGGPSLAEIDLDLVRGRRFVVVNSGCRKLRAVATADDVLYFTDNSWNENRPDLAAGWPGPVIAGNRNVKARLGDRVRFLDVSDLTEWMGAMPDFVQASSGHIAACLAARMGARRIVLYAFEGASVAGRTHGHGDYTAHCESVFTERFRPGWDGLAPAFKRHGVDVVNATPGGAISAFPRVTLSEALADDAT